MGKFDIYWVGLQTTEECYIFLILSNVKLINLLKTKRRLLYLKTQSVPHSKHYSSRL